MADANQAADEGAERKFTFTREFSVEFPKGEKAYMIPASEWQRVMRMVARIVPAKNWFLVVGSICAGISVSAFFCLLGFAASKDVPFGAKVMGWVAMITGAVLSLALFKLDSQQTGNVTQSTTDVTREMEQIEKLCDAAEAGEEIAAPQNHTNGLPDVETHRD